MLIKIAKRAFIVSFSFILLLFQQWIALALFVVFLVWRSKVKKRKAMELLLKNENDANIQGRLEEFNVVGVTHINEDGTNRQDILNKCYRGDAITLKYMPTEDKPHATEVWTKFGLIGSIASYDAEKFANDLQVEEGITGRIKKLLGGTAEKPTVDCIIVVQLPLESMPIEEN